MKIANYLTNSLIDYPGKLSCVVFTQGCNCNCWYCYNRDLIGGGGVDKSAEFLSWLPSRAGWLDAVVICGGEPTLQPDLADFCDTIHKMGFLVKLDTNGSNPDILASLIQNKKVDYVAMDIKTTWQKYPALVGNRVNVENIKKSVDILCKNNVPYEFRTTMSPDLTEQDIMDIANNLVGAEKWYLQLYVQPEFSDRIAIYSDEMLHKLADKCSAIVPTFVR